MEGAGFPPLRPSTQPSIPLHHQPLSIQPSVQPNPPFYQPSSPLQPSVHWPPAFGPSALQGGWAGWRAKRLDDGGGLAGWRVWGLRSWRVGWRRLKCLKGGWMEGWMEWKCSMLCVGSAVRGFCVSQGWAVPVCGSVRGLPGLVSRMMWMAANLHAVHHLALPTSYSHRFRAATAQIDGRRKSASQKQHRLNMGCHA